MYVARLPFAPAYRAPQQGKCLVKRRAFDLPPVYKFFAAAILPPSFGTWASGLRIIRQNGTRW
jgi:hypothetical protein